jgi:hypothetical protein
MLSLVPTAANQPQGDLFGDKPESHALPIYCTRDGIPPCRCGGDSYVVGPGVGAHHAKATCTQCGAMRWLPKTWRAAQ